MTKYSGRVSGFRNDIALLRLASDAAITNEVMPICVDWFREQPPLRSGDLALVSVACGLTPYTLHLTPCTLHLTPYTLHLAPYTLHLTLYTLQLTPYTLHLAPYTLHLTPYSERC